MHGPVCLAPHRLNDRLFKALKQDQLRTGRVRVLLLSFLSQLHSSVEFKKRKLHSSAIKKSAGVI